MGSPCFGASEEHGRLAFGVWAALPRPQVGIESLRPRLSMVLRDHILSSLPGLIDEAQATLRHSGEHLLRLGQARQTLVDQRRFLLRSSERFSLLVSNAVNGVYYDPYFGDAMSQEGYEKRLRAVVQNRLTDFSDTMRSRGEFRKIIDDSELVEENDSHVRRSLYVSEVQRRMRRTRGCELPGTFSPMIIGELFYIHASPWQTITTSFVDSLVPDLRKAVTLILRGIVDDKSLDGLLRHVINPKFDELEASFLGGLGIQLVVLFLSAAFAKMASDTLGATSQAWGSAAAAMVYIYQFTFCSTTLVVCWVYPTEIWPQEIRAKGNAFGILGWAMGAGSTTLALPSMFAALGWKTLMIFACFNVAAIPLVYFFFIETANRSLEEINLLFSLDNPLVSANEKAYAKMIEDANGNVAVAERRLMDSVDEANGEKDAANEISAVRKNTAAVYGRGDEKAVQYLEESKQSSIAGSTE